MPALGVIAVAAQLLAIALVVGEKGETDRQPLSDLMEGRWRIDVVPEDLLRAAMEQGSTAVPAESPQPEIGVGPDVADEGFFGYAAALVSEVKAFIISAPQQFAGKATKYVRPDEPAFVFEASPGLHEGVLLGTVRILAGGVAVLTDLAGTASLAADGPLLAVREDDVLSVVVECSTMTRCKAIVRPPSVVPASSIPIQPQTIPNTTERSPSSASNEEEATAPDPAPFGTLTLSLRFRPSTAVQPASIRVGHFVWHTGGHEEERSSTRSSAAAGSLSLLHGGKHAYLTLNLAHVDHTYRLIARRVATSLDPEDPSNRAKQGTWYYGSWTSALMYGFLFTVVVIGRFGAKWYFKRQGIDVDPWIRSLHQRRKKPQGKRALPRNDAEIRAQMARDDAADWSRKLRNANTNGAQS